MCPNRMCLPYCHTTQFRNLCQEDSCCRALTDVKSPCPPNDLICCLSQFYVPLFSFSSSFFLSSPWRISRLVSFMLSLHLQLSSALMFDAVHVVVGAVRELNRSQEIGVKPLSCTSSLIWQHGTSLMNYLRMVRVSMATPFAAIF